MGATIYTVVSRIQSATEDEWYKFLLTWVLMTRLEFRLSLSVPFLLTVISTNQQIQPARIKPMNL